MKLFREFFVFTLAIGCFLLSCPIRAVADDDFFALGRAVASGSSQLADYFLLKGLAKIPEVTGVSSNTPGSGADKGVTNEITVIALHELGKPPTKEEAKIIKKALKALNSSKFGKEICKPTGAAGCLLDDLQAARVEITTRDLGYHLPAPLESMLGYFWGSNDPHAATPKPSWVNGRTILCLDTDLVLNNPPEYVATFILHELSHVADNRNLGEADSINKNFATEYKANVAHMMIYDEFLRTGKLKANPTSDSIQFLISVYRWRSGGPKPNMNFSVVIKGKKYSAAEIIGLYVRPDDTGLKAVWHLTSFFTQLPEGTLTEADVKFLKGIHEAVKYAESKYVNWFPPQVVPANPGPSPQPPSPHPPSDGDGGHAGGGGEWVPPFTPNPYFPPGT